MRRTFLVLSAVFAAVTVAAFSAVLAQAQAVDQYEDSTGSSREADAVPKNTSAPKSASAPTDGIPPSPENVDEPAAAGLDDRVLNTVAEDPYSQVVDNAESGSFSAAGWRKVKDASAYGGSFVESAGRRGTDARFKVEVPDTGYYTVYARWAETTSNTSDARIGVSAADGVRWDSVDQTMSGTEWVTVGFFKLEEGASRNVLVSPGNGDDAVADAVMISKNVLVGSNAQMASVGDPDLTSNEGASPSKSTDLSARNTIRERKSVMRAARNHLGIRYDYDHRTCKKGMSREDCSCFTRNVFRHFGKTLPDSPVSQWKYGRKVSKSNTHRGDLVFSDLNKDRDLKDHYADHVSIWSGNGNIIHASSYFGKVVESKERYLDNYWGSKRLRIR